MADHQDKEQKTEEATPKRRQEAREKGQVPLSTEFVAALALTVGAGSLVFGGPRLMDEMGSGAVATFQSMSHMGTTELSVPAAAAILEESMSSILGVLALVTLPAIVVAAFAGFVQVGFQIAPKAMEPNLSKFDPVQGMKRLLSMRSVVRTSLAALKMSLITGVVFAIAWLHMDGILRSSTNELGPMLRAAGHLAVRCILGALVVVILLSLVDLIFQRYQHGRDLRMSKQEIKEEARLTDGDPTVRARIRRIQQELAMSRMMADVPAATVVVTNPTHYAVALRYEQNAVDSSPRAPVVVAKGVDVLAQRIKAVAAEHDVVCYEDVPLARALYAQTEVGQEIPEDLYSAVATVLGYVYRLRGMIPATAA